MRSLAILTILLNFSLAVLAEPTVIYSPDTPEEIANPTDIVNGDTIFDTNKLTELNAYILSLREKVKSTKDKLKVLDTVDNEINGMRGQLMNAYNQSFGFIGEGKKLYDAINADSEGEDLKGVIDNIKCLGDDISDLSKKETLLRASFYNYSGDIDDLVISQTDKDDPWQKFNYTGYYDAGIKNLSSCGNIKTKSTDFMKVRQKLNRMSEIMARIFAVNPETGEDQIDEYMDLMTEQIHEITDSISNSEVSLAEQKQYKVQLLTLISQTSMLYKQNLKDWIKLKLDNEPIVENANKALFEEINNNLQKQ